MADVPIPYLTPPADIVNLAIDKLGQPGKIIGSIGDGTVVSEAARRSYGLVLRALLRAAHWNFARKFASLTLLGDASMQSSPPNVPNSVVSTYVEPPWIYAYAWPTDGVQGRWMPAGFPLAVQPGQPNPPFTTAPAAPWLVPLLPGRFLVTSSDQYPISKGLVPWDQMPDLRFTEGLGPTSRKVILTDIPQAWFVYTRLVKVIEEWDDAFREAMSSLLAIVLAPVAIDDPKLRTVERDKQIVNAKRIIDDARVANGNEQGWPQTTEHQPPWISARNSGLWGSSMGGGAIGFAGGTLGLYLPWEPFSLGGSVF